MGNLFSQIVHTSFLPTTLVRDIFLSDTDLMSNVGQMYVETHVRTHVSC
jgi:hypothetical protein